MGLPDISGILDVLELEPAYLQQKAQRLESRIRRQQAKGKYMVDADLISRYNYDAFTPEKFAPWMRFDQSPALGQVAPDFPLTRLDGSTVHLKEVISAHTYTIAEFGSFT